MEAKTKKSKKIVHIKEETENIKIETGEVVNERTTYTKSFESSAPYIKLFCDDLLLLTRKPLLESTVLFTLLKFMSRKGSWDNIVDISTAAKQELSAMANMSTISFSNQLTNLINDEIISRIGKGRYMLNPNLFAKGEWHEIVSMREKYIELTLNYSDKKRKITFKKID